MVPMAAPPAELFACPTCWSALAWGSGLRCEACGRGYLSPDGVPCFNDTGTYHGPILPKPEMAQALALARTEGYRAVLRGYFAERDPELVRYISDRERTAGLRLLELSGDERILDFGCAFGLFSTSLAARAKLVVALDVTHEKLAFLTIMRDQDGLSNLVPVCNGDAVRLPFADGYFDWIILNAVFEYLPRSIDPEDVRTAHLRALREFSRVLKPDGRIYLATKNRFSYGALLGGKDHGPRFASVLPRRAARVVFRATRTDPSRHVVHSFREYRRLLEQAGFPSAAFYWAFPTLWYPRHLVPLSGSRAETLAALRNISVTGALKRACLTAAARSGLLPALVPNYIILAGKPRASSPVR